MLVRCKKYSVMYPNGSQNIGDIFDLSNIQADYFSKLKWVEILPEELQPKVKKGRKKIEAKNSKEFAVDLSKSKHNGRHLEKIFK